MSDDRMVKFVERIGRVVGKEARKAGLKPLRFDGGFLDDGTLIFTVDMSADRKEMH